MIASSLIFSNYLSQFGEPVVMQDGIVLSWAAIGVVVSVISGVLFLMTAYLKLIIKNTVSEIKEAIIAEISNKFVPKTLCDANQQISCLKTKQLEDKMVYLEAHCACGGERR